MRGPDVRQHRAQGASVRVNVLTELDTRVLLTHVLTLLVCEEHVCAESTLGCVGVLDCMIIS